MQEFFAPRCTMYSQAHLPFATRLKMPISRQRFGAVKYSAAATSSRLKCLGECICFSLSLSYITLKFPREVLQMLLPVKLRHHCGCLLCIPADGVFYRKAWSDNHKTSHTNFNICCLFHRARPPTPVPLRYARRFIHKWAWTFRYFFTLVVPPGL